MHARHRVGRRNTAEHRDGRRAGGEHDGIEQEAQNAAVADILEVAPNPLRRHHVQEVHVRRLRVAAEAGDEHHVERIEDEDAQRNHEQIQPAARQRLFQLAAAQAGDRAQQQEQRRKRHPDRPVGFHRQPAKHLHQAVARLPAVEEGVELRQQRVVLDVSADQQIHLPGERVVDRPHERRYAEPRDQRKHAGGRIQPVGRLGQIRARQFQRLVARAQQQHQRNRHRAEQQAHHVRRADARHALAVADAMQQEIQPVAADGFLHREGDHRRGDALGIDALGHALLDHRALVLRRDGLDLRARLDVFFVADERVRAALDIDARFKERQRQQQDGQRDDHAVDADEQRALVLPFHHA